MVQEKKLRVQTNIYKLTRKNHPSCLLKSDLPISPSAQGTEGQAAVAGGIRGPLVLALRGGLRRIRGLRRGALSH